LVLAGLGREARARWLTKVGVLRIVRMRTTRHLGPYRPQPGIADAFQANFRRVVTDDSVVPHHLNKCAPALCRGLEFPFFGKLLEQTVLLFRRTVHKITSEFRVGTCVHSIEPDKKSALGVVSRGNCVGGRAYVPG